MNNLVVVTLARKPCSEGTVAANVLKHGTGALNIRATRIPYTDDVDTSKMQRQQAAEGGVVDSAFGASALVGKEIPTYKPEGRWPANLILTADSAKEIDAQAPGAGAYFKAIDPTLEALSAYLKDMLCAPHLNFVFADPVSSVDWSTQGEVHAVVARGTPSQDEAKALFNSLAPGAHVALVAPPDSPTGHRGAVALETAGFEIRDSILWALTGQGLHYVPKAGKAEREAGVSHLAERRTSVKVVAVSEDAATELSDAGVDLDSLNSSALVPEHLRHLVKEQVAAARGNTHPTCKPKLVMERLLADVPKDLGPVLDPFLGSGTTMIACLATGHDGIGIEREKDYVEIATHRVRHWNKTLRPWDPAVVQSDFTDEVELLDVLDFFGD
jgi:hypothetical protein